MRGPGTAHQNRKAAVEVDWGAYATQYDTMCRFNPAYWALVDHLVETARSLGLPAGARIADLGAGTGNLAVHLAREFPASPVTAYELEPIFLERIREKAARENLGNLAVEPADLTADFAPAASFDLLMQCHVLYALPGQSACVKRFHNLLRPGGHYLVADIAAGIRYLSWAVYLMRETVRQEGLFGALRFFRENPDVRKANRAVNAKFAAGTFPTHTPASFRALLEGAGFQVLKLEDRWYRSTDLVAVCRKA